MSLEELWQIAAGTNPEVPPKLGEYRQNAMIFAATGMALAAEEVAEQPAPDDSDMMTATEFELENITRLLESLNQQDNRTAHAREQAALFRSLALANPQLYGPTLVDWLENLIALLIRDSQVEDALEGLREICRQTCLEEAALSGYRRRLADVLQVLAETHMGQGQFAQAQPHLEERVTLLRQMLPFDPAVLPELALTLNNLGSTSFGIDRSLAIACIEESVGIRRALAADDPQRYLPGLSIALNNLGDLCMRSGDLDSARVHLGEAVRLRGPLAQQDPANYRVPLLRSMNNLSATLEALGRDGELLSLTTEVRNLAEALFFEDTAFVHDYAHALTQYAYVRAKAGVDLEEVAALIRLVIRIGDRVPQVADALSGKVATTWELLNRRARS